MKTTFWLTAGLVVLSSCHAKNIDQSNIEDKVNMTSVKIDQLFQQTKQVCFGRYIITVPEETQVVYGATNIDLQPNAIYPNRAKEVKQIVAEGFQKLKDYDGSAQLIHQGSGPIAGSWYKSDYEDSIAAKTGSGGVMLVVPVGPDAFQFGALFSDRKLLAQAFPNNSDVVANADKAGTPTSEQDAMNRIMALVNSTRYLKDNEIPTEPGFCVPHGFIKDSTYMRREEMQIGLRFPSLPDVSFSINSQNFGSLEGEDGWGILKRVEKQKSLSGSQYGGEFLRIGLAPLHTWQNGEEVLARIKKNGALEFTWAQVGTKGSVANPNDLTIKMFTKVEGNSAGTSDKTSVSDEEAVILWDKLLSSFKFRVPVGNGDNSANTQIKPGSVCPKTGFWQCPQLEKQSTIFMRKGDIMPGQSYKVEGYEIDKMIWQWVRDA